MTGPSGKPWTVDNESHGQWAQRLTAHSGLQNVPFAVIHRVTKMKVMSALYLRRHGYGCTGDAEALLHNDTRRNAAPRLTAADTDGVLSWSLNEVSRFVNKCKLARFEGKGYGLRLAGIQMDPAKSLQRPEGHARR